MSAFVILGDPKNREVLLSIETATEAQRQGIRRGFFKLGKELRAEARREITKGLKTGVRRRVRGRTGRMRWHTASAAGESHANVTFKLRESIGWKAQQFETYYFGYGVALRGATPAPRYAAYVEDGTSKMSARPSLQNAMDVILPKTARWFAAEIMKEFEG
jgi:HK97 gp10 family phage protein